MGVTQSRVLFGNARQGHRILTRETNGTKIFAETNRRVLQLPINAIPAVSP
jgi:hypothetical protein